MFVSFWVLEAPRHDKSEPALPIEAGLYSIFRIYFLPGSLISYPSMCTLFDELS